MSATCSRATVLQFTQSFARGEIDFSLIFAAAPVFRLDDGVPITVLAGVHPGCFELFAHDPFEPSAT